MNSKIDNFYGFFNGRFFASCLILFCTSYHLYAADESRYWKSIGPEGAAIERFKSDPDDADIVYAFDFAYDGSTQAIYKSFNSGTSWVALPESVSINPDDERHPAEHNSNINIIATVVNQAGIMYGETVVDHYAWGKYIGNTKTLFKSIDGGLNWINIKLSEAEYRGNFMVSRESSAILYASFVFLSERGEKVMVSHNAGEDWQELGKPRENTIVFDITRLYSDSTDSRIFYANLRAVKEEDENDYQTRIAKSYNSGDSWQVINISPYHPGEIAINKQNHHRLLMAYGDGILLSENGGLDWQLSNSGLQKIGGILSVEEDRNGERGMYIADPWFGFYYKSFDDGVHWQALWTKSPVSGKCHSFKINPVDLQEIICQTRSGLFVSKDAGNHWETLIIADSEFPEAVYARDGKTIYVYFDANPQRGLSKSTNSGLRWETIPNIIKHPDSGVTASSIEEFSFTGLPVIHPENLDIIYSIALFRGEFDNLKGEFASITGLYKSTDGGNSWQLLIHEVIEGDGVLLMHPLNPDRMIFFIGQKSYWLSDDGGENWTKTLGPLIASHNSIAPEVVFDPYHLDGLFWDKEGIVHHSTDQGTTWERVNKSQEEGEHGTLLSNSEGVFSY